MKTAIVYFSQSGSTQKAAEAIAQGMEDREGAATLIPMGEAEGKALREYDLIGVGCPVHAWHAPYNMTNWIRGLPNMRGKAAFVFNTYGGISTGNTLHEMARELKKKGLVVIGGFRCVGRHNMPPMMEAGVAALHPNSGDLKAAHDFGKKVLKKARQGEAKDMTGRLYTGPMLKNLVGRLNTPENLFRLMPNIEVNATVCQGCGTCVEICDVDNIILTDEGPVYQGVCLSCFQCYTQCPTGALKAHFPEVLTTLLKRAEPLLGNDRPEAIV